MRARMSGKKATGKASSSKLVSFGLSKAASTPLASSKRLGRPSPLKKATPIKFGGRKPLQPNNSTVSGMGTSSSKATEKKRQRTTTDGDSLAEGEHGKEEVPSKDLREEFVKDVAPSKLSPAKKQRADEGQDDATEVRESQMCVCVFGRLRSRRVSRCLTPMHAGCEPPPAAAIH